MAKMLVRSLFCPFFIVNTLALSAWSYGLNQSRNQPSSLATTVAYHGGPLLTRPSGINIYLIWYGAFSLKDRTTITDFFASFSPKGLVPHQEPSVSTWWRTVTSYKDKAHTPVSRIVRLVKQVGDPYSLGKNLKRAQIGNLVNNNIVISNKLPVDSNAIYLVLTAKDVSVEKFCMDSCGFHDSVLVTPKGSVIVYAHVGDAVQCPGFCAWPYALPAYGPPGQALVAPNGVGADGMVINIATILAGATTNPFRTGYFQGDILAPLEAVTACPGIFGAGAYPGYPGNLMVDKFSKASYNVYGANGEKFLLPAVWDLVGLTLLFDARSLGNQFPETGNFLLVCQSDGPIIFSGTTRLSNSSLVNTPSFSAASSQSCPFSSTLKSVPVEPRFHPFILRHHPH